MKQTGLSLVQKLCLLLLLFGLLAACGTTSEEVHATGTTAVSPTATPLPNDPIDAAAEAVTLLRPDRAASYEAGSTLLCVAPVDVKAIADTLRALPALRVADARDSGLTHEQIVALRGYLDGVSVIETVEINGTQYDSNVAALTLSPQNAQETIDTLSLFPELKTLTVSGLSLSPDTIRSIRESRPDLTLVCDAALFGQTVPLDAEALDLSDVPEAELFSVVSLFPALKSVTLGEIPPARVQELEASNEVLAVTYRFRGQTVSKDVTALDLSGGGVPSAAELDALFLTAPQLSELTVDDPDETETEALVAFNPREKGVVLHCTLTVLDTAFEADAERIDFGSRKVADEETAAVEAVLPLFTNLTEIDMYDSTLTKETMDRLFDGYPDIFFGWTFGIWDNFYVVRSDATAFSSFIGLPGSHRWGLTEDDFSILRYCKGLQALDLGHCGIRNLDFLRNWPHMKILILADTPLTDIHVIAELQELEYLELFLTTPDSYEPLTHLPNLIDLNLCHTKKEGNQYRDDEEIMMLTGIKTLERLWISKTLNAEQAQMLRDNLPGVEFDFYSTGSTDNGWRKHPRYYVMRRCFETREYQPFN